ncbi:MULTISPECIES: flagellar basal-body rod protein FlgG [Psychromonas]|uniref:flagellar basal-body rod protein FlgG n=1 Tax=Psychromonas TaxID=67572 RepID=UPI0025B21C0E|nr:flagellar basal-body rod protein FlgG [Psychromonas sp. 14N.309.X.WAT.B.A12]MDN2663969.1 flagellar basal-body rod protein FlgG [Psychromonas sp. 14N.309.X.WAT.B.A12]
MHSALWISKTGLDAQQTNVATISNNLANASTVGFKKSRAIFEDLLYQNVNQPGANATQDTKLPSGLMIGSGAKVVAVQKNFSQGNALTTNNSLDVMIDGKGFFEIEMPDGSSAFTRNGQFMLNEEGVMVTPGSGYPLVPQVQIPDDAQSISIGAQGEVSVSIAGQAANQVVGQLNVNAFINASGLEPLGENLFAETGASGAPIEGVPGADGLGFIRQGMLETSNVNVTEELVNLIESQRVYEMNSKVVSAVDEMLSYISQQL